MDEELKQSSRLYRSKRDRFIAGVCGGIADYFHIDSNLVRILFVISIFFGGLGIVLYLAAMLIVPENPSEEAQPHQQVRNNTLFWGILLIVIGAILLLKQLHILDYFYIRNLPWSTIWAFFLIAVGIILLISHRRPQSEEGESGEETSGGYQMNIFRSRTDRKIAGVCGGLAQYFNIDSSLIRLGWILATLASAGLGILIYILFIFIFPEESTEQTA